MVKESWNGYMDSSVLPRLSRCTGDMSAWSKQHCNKLKLDIENCRRELILARNNSTGEDQTQMWALWQRMNRLLLQHDVYWRQRAKTHWYRDGDRNTKFFHAAATSRKKVNKILSLEDEHGHIATDNQGMRSIAQNYFLNLFQPQNSVMDPVLNVIRHSVTPADNQLLLAPFTKEEFRIAMFSMPPDKCPGPDGYSPGFYQHFWSLCSDEIFT